MKRQALLMRICLRAGRLGGLIDVAHVAGYPCFGLWGYQLGVVKSIKDISTQVVVDFWRSDA